MATTELSYYGTHNVAQSPRDLDLYREFASPRVGMTVERPGFTIHSSPSLLRILCCEFIYSPNSFATPKLILKVLSVIPLWEQNSWVVMLPSYVCLAEAQQSDALLSYCNSYIMNKGVLNTIYLMLYVFVFVWMRVCVCVCVFYLAILLFKMAEVLSTVLWCSYVLQGKRKLWHSLWEKNKPNDKLIWASVIALWAVEFNLCQQKDSR